MCIGPEAEFFIDQTKLKNVNSFKYPGTYVTNDCSMKEELTARIQATSLIPTEAVKQGTKTN